MSPKDIQLTPPEFEDPEKDCDVKSGVVLEWDSECDPGNPVNWPKKNKWLLTGFSLFMSFMIGLNALCISSAATVINERFGISDESFPNSYWTVTSWNIGAAIAPVFGLPLMENFGVRNAYLASYALFVAFVIPQAVAPNYATLIITRFFAGGFGSIVQNSAANVIANIWVEEENSTPLVMFTYVYLLGFTLGPTIGSAIVQFLYWRWMFYIELILYAPLLPVAWILIKETRASIILAARDKKRAEKSGIQCTQTDNSSSSFSHLLYEGTVRPVHLFFTEPVLFFFTIWSGLAVGNVYLASQSIAQIFGTNYGFDDVQAGYVEAALAVGETIGIPICIYQNIIYHNSAAKNKRNPGVPIPEARISLSIPVSFIAFAGGLFMYGWTSYSFVHWIGPTIALGLLGVGIMVIVSCAVIYIEDSYGTYGGSAIAAVALLENLISGLLPLASSKMYTNLGFQWASSLLGFFALALSFAPVVLYIKGPQIRARSKFMRQI